MNPSTLVTQSLLGEIANTSLSLDTVYMCYGAAALAAAALWTLGVVVFGRCRTAAQTDAPRVPSAGDRVTPAAL